MHRKKPQYDIEAPLERKAFDAASAFSLTGTRNRYILVVIDYFSQ